MEETEKGWVIVNMGHPATGKKYILNSTFQYTKRSCIRDFIKDSAYTWNYWKSKYNFRCVRAGKTIATI